MAGSAALGLFQHRPPDPPASDRDASGFSLQRAVAHVERIAQLPHPTGSPEADAVRRYIGEELRRSHLTPSEQSGTRLGRNGPGRFQWGTSRNVLGRVRGYGSRKAVMLAAHYDSVPSSPGASDNAAGVAALLESARVLQRGPAPRNDVIFLFTEGEESGTSGADIFAAGHPWARDVAVVMNFDARGTAGPSLMFETSAGNGWLIQQLARGAAFPRASSLYYEIYRRMPNDTDLTIFKHHGMAGLNFAFVEQPGRYHTSGDTAAALDRATLYHHGHQAVSVAKALAEADLSSPKAPDVVYFALFDRLIVYSQTWLWIVVGIAALLLIALLMLVIRSGAVTWGSLALGIVATLLAVIVSGAAGYGVWTLAVRFVPALAVPGFVLYVNAAYGIAIVLLSAAVAWAAIAAVGRWTSRAAMVVCGALVGGIAALLASVSVPGASYLLVWPWLAGLVCAIGLLRYGARDFWTHTAVGGSRSSLADAAASAWLALPAGLLAAPVIWILFTALGVRGAIPVSVLVALTLVLMMPLLLVIAGTSPGRMALGVGVVAIATLVAAAVRIEPSASWPVRNNVFYARSLDDGKAVWGTRERAVDAWTSTIVGRAPQRGAPVPCFAEAGQFLYRAASVVAPAATRVTVVRDELAGAERIVDLQIDSKPGTWWLLGNRSPQPSRVALVEVNGIAVDAGHRDEPFRAVTVGAAPQDPVVVRLRTAPRATVHFTLYDAVDELPPSTASPRPAWIVRGIEGPLFNDASASCQTVSIGGARATGTN